MRDTQNYASIPPEPASNDQSLAALTTSLGAGIVLPTDISTLCAELRVLAANITRDNPDYQEVHSKLKELKHHIATVEPNSMPEASPEVLQSIHPILARRIESLESSLCCVTEAFGGPPLLQQTAGTTYSDRVKFLTSGVWGIFNRRALEIFEPPRLYTATEELPWALHELVGWTAKYLLNLGRLNRGFTKPAFDNWFTEATDIWKTQIYPQCLRTDSDGSEYMVGDLPTWRYDPNLEYGFSLDSLCPAGRSHTHLGFLHSATRALDLIATDAATTRAMLGPHFLSFLNGDALVCRLIEGQKYHPSLTLRMASHEGTPGIEIAVHPDQPRHRYDQALAKVSVRFLTPELPIIVACQGVAADPVINMARRLPLPDISEFAKDLHGLSNTSPNIEYARRYFQEHRKEVCRSIGARTVLDAALLSTIIVLSELGFKSVLGISDADQHAMLDQSDIKGKPSHFYATLFRGCGFKPPGSGNGLFWSLPLDSNSFCIDSQFKDLPNELSYYAIALSRDPLKSAKRVLNADSPHAPDTKDSQLFDTFCEVLLPGAQNLAKAIERQEAFTVLSFSSH